jgi:hypothetical protein
MAQYVRSIPISECVAARWSMGIGNRVPKFTDGTLSEICDPHMFAERDYSDPTYRASNRLQLVSTGLPPVH